MKGTVIERFEAKVASDPTTGCWLWTARVNRHGYGVLSIGSKRDASKRMALAHRVAYELHVGPIPEGLTIDHLCRTPACVNPDHLEAVTQRENVLRGMSIPALNHKKTHCKNGHEFSPRSNGTRRCKVCDLEDCRRRRKRLKGG